MKKGLENPKDPGNALWLDRQLSGRLSHCGDPEEGGPANLRLRLRLWQWRMLGQSLRHAARDSLWYAKAIGDAAEVLLKEAAEAEGLPAFTGNKGSLPTGIEAAGALERGIARVLSGLPFTLPEDLAAAADAFLAVGHGDVSGIISLPTSGTTGAGKRIYCSEEDLRETAAFFQHGMRYMVLPGQGDHVALLMSGDRPGSVGDLLARAMADLGVPCSVPGFVPLTPDGEEALVRRLIAIAPTCIVGVPGQLLLLARHKSAPALAKNLRCVLLSGDSVAPVTREAIAKGLGCEVFVHYGLTETGLGGAVECREHTGCHMREADLIHEVLDEQGHALPVGTWGEVVITTLTRRAMPLLRYRTGDEGRILPGVCPCGSVFGRLQVRGRMSERLSLPDGGSLHVTDFDRALYALPFVRSYRAVLHGQGESACLVLHVRLVHNAPETALETARNALAAVSGIRPVAGARNPDCREGLPVLVRRDGSASGPEESTGILRRGQAKQSILRTDKPVDGEPRP